MCSHVHSFKLTHKTRTQYSVMTRSIPLILSPIIWNCNVCAANSKGTESLVVTKTNLWTIWRRTAVTKASAVFRTVQVERQTFRRLYVTSWYRLLVVNLTVSQSRKSVATWYVAQIFINVSLVLLNYPCFEQGESSPQLPITHSSLKSILIRSFPLRLGFSR